MTDPLAGPARRAPGPCLSRRALLGAGAGGGLVLTVAACGAGVPAVDGVAGGDRIAALADVPAGGALELQLDGRRVLLVRSPAGAVVGWDAQCPHRGCTVRALDGGGLGCPCHGSAFDPATGEVLEGPATRGLTPLPVTVSGEQVLLG